MDMGSGYTPPFSPVAPRKVRVNFDTHTRLCNILGVGRQLAQAIVVIRENTGNLVPNTLGTIIGRPLTMGDMTELDFSTNPALFKETLWYGDGAENASSPMYPHGRRANMPVLEDPVSREKAQLMAQITALEADLNASYERFKSQTTSSRSLNYGRNPQEAKNLPRPESYVTLSQTPRISREFNLPPGRPDREPVHSPVTTLKTETRSPITRPRLHLGVLSDDNEAFLHQLSLLNAARALPSPPVTSTPATIYPPVVSGLVTNNPPATNNTPAPNNCPTISNPPAPNIPTVPAVMTIPSNPPGPSIPPTQKDRDVLTKLPKSLLYDGQSNWFVFQSKFERYARVQDWSDAECADCLGWCLTGKAVDFYALLTEGRGTVPYAELMQRLQERFGARELTATAQGRFHVAYQEVGESLDNWSDRALKLATAAFRDLPYAYAAEQAVTKFCHGLIDEEAGKHVSLQLPTSMGDAMNMLKIYCHVQSACAAAPRYTQETEQEESMWVHEVKKAPTADEVSVSAVDKLTQVVEKLLDAVERLSNSFGSSAVDPFVRQPGKPFRNKKGYAEYPVECPYPGKVPNRWYNDQRQVMYPAGAGGGGARGHRNQNSKVRPEGSYRGRYGSNWGHFHAMSLPNHKEKEPVVVAATTKQLGQPEVDHVNQLGPVSQFCMKVQHAKDVHDAVPLVLPTVPDVVSDPRMVICESTEGDHGDPVCDDEFRVQRVAVQSAEAAKSMATDRADQVGAKIAQRKAAETTPATGRPVPVRRATEVTACDRREGGACGCRVTPDDSWEGGV
ncbi:hypothetical protein DPMN_028089 [Dreissena polymorpha]|uniref:Uncharacterized protein n=1 Tax=Dreissena polymorpha TaxID=45954 RepID=A0A9D4RE22_DREPO|nr:hypothetical protein DPMN_028089 [Dreissena polymorpha]